MTALPRITIITPVLNRADMIADALASVRDQGYPAVEHIVLDGGSTDGTVEILRATPGIRWFSERDRGLYDAINKGLRLAQGEIIGHLNSDDAYLPGAFMAAARALVAHPEADAACGGAVVVRAAAGGGWQTVRTIEDERVKRLDWHSVTRGVPITNARFFRSTWYKRAGNYDLRYRLAADREFLIRSLTLGVKTIPLAPVVYRYRLHPQSLTINDDTRRDRILLNESLVLARSVMAATGFPAGLRRAAWVWYAVEMARLSGQQAAAGEWFGASRSALEAAGRLIVWPLVAAVSALRPTGTERR